MRVKKYLIANLPDYHNLPGKKECYRLRIERLRDFLCYSAIILIKAFNDNVDSLPLHNATGGRDKTARMKKRPVRGMVSRKLYCTFIS